MPSGSSLITTTVYYNKLVILGVDNGLALLESLQSVETVKHGPKSLGDALAELWLGGVAQVVLEEVTGTADIAGGRGAVAAVEGAALNLEVVLADVDYC